MSELNDLHTETVAEMEKELAKAFASDTREGWIAYLHHLFAAQLVLVTATIPSFVSAVFGANADDVRIVSTESDVTAVPTGVLGLPVHGHKLAVAIGCRPCPHINEDGSRKRTDAEGSELLGVILEFPSVNSPRHSH